jgi:hypothetical protein
MRSPDGDALPVKDDIEAARRRHRRRIGTYVEDADDEPTKIAL